MGSAGNVVAERENFVVLHRTERGNVTDTVAVPAVILRWRWLKPWGSGEAHALATEYPPASQRPQRLRDAFWLSQRCALTDYTVPL
jgi:hypothetical protein